MSRTQSQRGKSPTRKRLQTTLGGSSLIADHEKEKDVEEIMDHTNLSPKVRLDEEKKSYDKAQRTHERMLKRLEEASARTATREARFRLKEREFQDAEVKLVGEYEKLSKEIARARESMRTQVRKAEERSQTKEGDWDNREQKKVAVYNATVKELREKIEHAKSKLNDTEQALNLEAEIRKLRDEVKETELVSRTLTTELEDKQEEHKQERDIIDRAKEKLQELDEAQVKYTEVRRDKKRLQRQFEELEKDVQKQQKDLESKGDEEDIWSLKTQLRDLKNEGDDLQMRKDKMETQIKRVQAGRVALDTNTSKITSNYDSPSTSRTGTGRSTETSSRLPPARKYEGSTTGRSSVLDRLGDKYQTGTTATSRVRKDEPTRQEQAKITELKGLKRDYETRSGSKASELEKLRKQVSDATSQKEKTEQLLKKLEEDSIQLQKLIKQEKEVFQADISSLNQKIEITKKKNETVTAAHLNRLNKAKKDRQFQLSEIQEQVKIESDRIQERRTEMRKLETAMKQKERNAQRGDRELQNAQKTLVTIFDKLVETENNLASSRQFLEETLIEFENTEQDMMSEIHCLEREIYDQTETREYLEQVTAELQKEVDDLNWYFMDHKQKNPKDSRIHGTYEFDWVTHRRETTTKELSKIDSALAAVSVTTKWKDRSLEDLRKSMKKIMKAREAEMEEGDFQDFNARLLDLIKAMMNKQYSGIVTFQMVCLLAEENVYAGILNYLTLLTIEQENLHVLHRPPMFLGLVYRFWKTVTRVEDPDKSFRRVLLEKLIELRVNIQKKDPNYSTQFHQRVLDGEEMTKDEIDSWIYDAAEYFIFYGNDGTKEDIEINIRGLGDDEDDEIDEDDF